MRVSLSRLNCKPNWRAAKLQASGLARLMCRRLHAPTGGPEITQTRRLDEGNAQHVGKRHFHSSHVARLPIASSSEHRDRFVNTRREAAQTSAACVPARPRLARVESRSADDAQSKSSCVRREDSAARIHAHIVVTAYLRDAAMPARRLSFRRYMRTCMASLFSYFSQARTRST